MCKKKLYAAYGSNMNLSQMAHRCPFAKKVGIGIIENYELVFARNGYADITPKKDSIVPVVIWELTDDCEARLDIYEGYPRFYEKKSLSVWMEGKHLSMMVYCMTYPYNQIRCAPPRHYFETIKEGIAENSLSGVMKTYLNS